MIRKIDAAIIRWVQSAYLWIYDLTGMFVGTVIAGSVLIVVLGDVLVAGKNIDVTRFLIALTMIGVAAHAWWRQAHETIRTYNVIAMAIASSPVRVPIIGSCIIMDIATIALSPFAPTLSMAIWGIVKGPLLDLPLFMMAVMIREREPPNWFHKPATEGV